MKLFGHSLRACVVRRERRKLWPTPLFLFFLAVVPCRAEATDLTGSGSASVVSGDSYDYVYGRRAVGGDAVANGSMVNVSGGTVSRDLYGGSALSRNGSAEALNNSVTVSGGLSDFNDNIYGGYARSYVGGATADGNSVSMDGSLRFGPWVQAFGGYARMSGGSGFVESVNNRVTIGGSAALNFVVGGEAYAETSAQGSSRSADNAVRLENGSVSLLYGGYAIAPGDASSENNVVSIAGGIFGDVVGGEVHSYEGTALAEGNMVTITGGTGTSNVLGASVQGDEGAARASGNKVNVSGASIAGSVTGAFAPESSVPAELTGNSVTLAEGAIVEGHVVGGAVTGTAPGSRVDSNTVTVTDGGLVQGDVTGGMAEAENSSVSYNTVLVQNAFVGGSLYGGSTGESGSADGNMVTVASGGSIEGDVTGGMTGAGSSSANDNTVLVQNAFVGGSLYGGSTGEGGEAAFNSVIIGRGASFAPTTAFYGGFVGNSPVAAAGSGNTLFVDSWQGSVSRVAGFENLHFVLPAPGAPVNVPMLAVTNAQSGDFDGSTVTAQLPEVITGGLPYKGSTFVLLSDASGAVAQASAGRLISLQQGYVAYYDGILENTGTAVQLHFLEEVRMNPRIAALTEARAAASGLLNQGADLAADAGLRHAREAAEHEDEHWRPFAAVYGGASRYHTGSRADTEGFSGMTGLTGSFSGADGRTVLGGFFEFGRAHLDTFNGFVSGDVNGRGDSRYMGAGMLARYDVVSGPLAGLYAEGVGRVGNIDTTWHSDDLRDNVGRPADYDLSNPYYGGHLGLGCVLGLGESLDMDVYGKFFWTHQDGDGADMNGDAVHFNSVDSRRLRMGARFDWKAFEDVTPYAGAAWEHEYSGTAHAVANDFSIPDASLKGDSAVFELGLAVEPGAGPLTLDAAFTGSAGERDSLGGHLTLLYRF
ncbi:autotransporter outer membrane beta-barrel domain-containing protein [uncultured Mailhella sp.]|uniref:autotransporter outer membrane beta-barrel domain-containing protein n=1 Tax=uncultured Mailhella sp. TaxID=1981031 RepID=UPI0025DC4748|nr:autotransporter outer membrane beta-barrel domain-containing protein [uncultured Mailhella sp.]